MSKSRSLKDRIQDRETLIVPDAYDGLSAQIIEACGFEAVQCSGHSIARAKGIASENELSLEANLLATHDIVTSVSIPVMADGEDGYAEDALYEQNLEQFHRAGVAGINIEDQDLRSAHPSLCLLDEQVAVTKIKRAVALKQRIKNPDWVINARTDALRSSNKRSSALDVAIKRANQYLEAGADLAFVAYVETLDEIRTLIREIKGPLSIAAGLPYNVHRFSVRDCIELGIARVSYPTLLIDSAESAMKKALSSIHQTSN